MHDGGGLATYRPTLTDHTQYVVKASAVCMAGNSALDVSCPLVLLDSTQQEFNVFGVRGFFQLEKHPDPFTEFLCGFLSF